MICPRCEKRATTAYCGNCGCKISSTTPIDQLKAHCRVAIKSHLTSADTAMKRRDRSTKHSYYDARIKSHNTAAQKWETWLRAIEELESNVRCKS